MRDACTSFGQSDKVFAVVQVLGIYGDPILKCAQEQKLPFLANDGAASGYYSAARGYVITTQPSTLRTNLNMARELVRTGELRGKKVGVVYYDGYLLPDNQRLLAQLRADGVDVVEARLSVDDTARALRELPVLANNLCAGRGRGRAARHERALRRKFLQNWSRNPGCGPPAYAVSDFTSRWRGLVRARDAASFFRRAAGGDRAGHGEVRVGQPEPARDAACREITERRPHRSATRAGSADTTTTQRPVDLPGADRAARRPGPRGVQPQRRVVRGRRAGDRRLETPGTGPSSFPARPAPTPPTPSGSRRRSATAGAGSRRRASPPQRSASRAPRSRAPRRRPGHRAADRLTYGVLAAGLVLVFRSSGVINFAHAETGALGAALLARMVTDGGVPWAVALPVALAVGAAVGAVVEVSVVRRLRAAPRVVLLVATLGVSQLLLVAQFSLPEAAQSGALFPVPFERTVELGAGIVLDASAFLALGLVPPPSSCSRCSRAHADWPGGARRGRQPRGRRARRHLDGPLQLRWSGRSPALSRCSPSCSRTACAHARLRHRPRLGPGLLAPRAGRRPRRRFVRCPSRCGPSSCWASSTPSRWSTSRAPRGSSTAGHVRRGAAARALPRGARRAAARGATTPCKLAGLAPERPVPMVLRDTWWAPRLGRIGWTALGALALLVPLLGLDAGQLQAVSRVPLLAIVGLSLVVLTGWAGQLSLGQIAIYGLGAFTAAALVQRGVPFPAAVAEATVLGVVAALLIGLPALLVRGLFLAVTTLAFAVAASSGLFQAGLFVDDSRVAVLDPGTVLGLDLRDGSTYYYVCLAALVLCCGLVTALRRSGAGRAIIAVRANPARASSLTLSPAVVRLSAFAVSGGLAAFAGALFAGLQRSISYTQFPVFDSLVVVALVMIGGAGSAGGAVLGALWVYGVPRCSAAATSPGCSPAASGCSCCCSTCRAGCGRCCCSGATPRWTSWRGDAPGTTRRTSRHAPGRPSPPGRGRPCPRRCRRSRRAASWSPSAGGARSTASTSSWRRARCSGSSARTAPASRLCWPRSRASCGRRPGRSRCSAPT
jgi:ABC-type branched-subunit amino acid transport system permease subunit